MNRINVFGDHLRLTTVESLTISGLFAVILDLLWVLRDSYVHGFNFFYLFLALGFLYVIYTTIKILIIYHKKRAKKDKLSKLPHIRALRSIK